ncbi:MAG: tRNA (cytidine(56)-2'-O)-methyltransferase [Candidatus Hodarchaeota archaeon]
MKVEVLRLRHRIIRDQRVTTHVGLVARAFGANSMIFCGQRDEGVIETINKVVGDWGGEFEVRYGGKNWKKIIRDWKEKKGGKVIHLTMYGEPLFEVVNRLRRGFNESDFLVVMGGEKVPKRLFKMADFNVSITNQPHSEIAALAVFLDHLFQGEELKKEFENVKIKVIPSSDKKIIKKKEKV